MSDVNTETGEAQGGRSPRFTYWVAFLVFSAITLGASVGEKNETKNRGEYDKSAQNWAVAASAITFTITFFVTAAQLHPVGNLFVAGTRLEGIIALVLTVFWAVTVAVISDPGNGLAVDSAGGVANGNLYYFSWAGFVTAVMLIVSYLRSAFGVDMGSEMQQRGARLTAWSALLAAALVVMGSSSRIFDQDCNPNRNFSDAYCTRTKYGIALGAITTAFSLAIVGMKLATSSAPFMAESVFSIILTIMNALGVALLTSTKGPAAPLGNLYYFSWISVLCAGMVLASCVEDWKSGKASGEGGEDSENTNGEIQVESLDETI